MPIYEYECQECHRRSSFLIYRISDPFEPHCKKCRSKEVKRLISRVNVHRSEESRLESLADPSSLAGLDEKDPRSIAKWMKKMGKEFGEEMGGEDMDQMVEEAMEEESKSGKEGGSLEGGYEGAGMGDDDL
jgi:putative FmdB family regulatory protein